MSFGGNNRAQVFFKQHGWQNEGRIDAKYTSRAAELYKQLLAKEVSKSVIEGTSSPTSPVASQSAQPVTEVLKEDTVEKVEIVKEDTVEKTEVPTSPKIAHAVFTSSVKKPIGAKKTGKIGGGLGARKLSKKTSESLYEQKPEEARVQVVITSDINKVKSGVSLTFPSRFEYTDNVQEPEKSSSGGNYVGNHVAPPTSSNFFSDYGIDSGFSKKTTSSKVQVEETDEARKKFSNAKSISSAQFFGDQNKSRDVDSQAALQKFSGSSSISSADLFGHGSDNSAVDLSASEVINRLSFQAQQDISSLKNIAGETGKKLSSIASNLMSDFQDRML
jgi:ADP-ribosylation factor GTPase-activating protein 2/3